MTDHISPQYLHDSEGVSDWRVLGGRGRCMIWQGLAHRANRGISLLEGING
jgi:hypothetical protein